ncbi:MAG TPA: AAA family ATPase [Polyangiaceae bacterium]|nr:AAA family ATPase [Polyangiaceae bacterium]
MQAPPPEVLFEDELRFLEAWDPGRKPKGFRMTAGAVVTFVMGSAGEALKLPKAASARRKSGAPLPASLVISPKLVGARALVERCVVTLAGERGLLLVGEPGTAKSMLSELLAAAISGTSALTVQGTAGTTEDQLRYGWNYALLLAKGPHKEAIVPSPVLTAMRKGALARVEEVTRCLPEVQDALVSILSDRRLAVPELSGDDPHVEHAEEGFNVIATANLRDRGVSEMSAALKRRFNFETVPPIADAKAEVALVKARASRLLERADTKLEVDDAVLEAIVTVFRDLRLGRTEEGYAVEKPSAVMSTAEAVSVASSIGLSAAFLPSDRDLLGLVPGYLFGVVTKDDAKDQGRLLAYWDGAVKKRAEGKQRVWQALFELRGLLEG